MKFSIVTPAYNMERWVRETIESVLWQEGDFEIEYIFVDDGSKDATPAIAQEYEARVNAGTYPIKCNGITMRVIKKENGGMFSAVNRGFAEARGDIFAWINADDIYEPLAFSGMAKVFSAYPEIQWLKGYSCTIDTEGRVMARGKNTIYRQDWLRDGVYGMESYFVQQETAFWTADLWKKAGPVPESYWWAGDCWLWIQMAKHAPLWSMEWPISRYRKREGQISKGIVKYKAEQWRARPHRSLSAWKARLFFSPQTRLAPRGEKFFLWLYPLLFMRGARAQQYITFRNGIPEKKWAKTFIIGENPSYIYDAPSTDRTA
jgi:glycosyltransferase involved in cell wall biosynthesis